MCSDLPSESIYSALKFIPIQDIRNVNKFIKRFSLNIYNLDKLFDVKLIKRNAIVIRNLRNVRYLPQYIQLCNSQLQHMLKYSSRSCSDPCSDGRGSKHSISYKPYVPICHQDHDHKNMSLKRPMSPHLTIHAPTLPAMTSITQRITGAILTLHALVLSGSTLFLSNGIYTLISMIQSLNLGGFSVMLLKLILGLPFAYHYFIGIRFCLWNAGKMLTLKEIYKSAYIGIAAAGALAFILAMR